MSYRPRLNVFKSSEELAKQCGKVGCVCSPSYHLFTTELSGSGDRRHDARNYSGSR